MNAAAAAAAAGAGGEGGGALLEVVGSVEAELKALMDAKPSWEQLEEALAAKGDLDKVLTKADAASFLATVLTEIYLCGICSCQEILRRNGRG
eukprot:COSAG01_NODE_15776_length_1300_cov_16.487094_2_plen_93_part_00